MKISGIYQIQSRKKPNRIYIGSAVDIYHRWNNHLSDLRKNKHHSRTLQRHFNKYGKNDLVFSVIICCDKEDLISIEQFYLDSYKYYFNGAQKAGSRLGCKHTSEARQKMSESKKGEKHNYYGKHFSEETKRKISESKIGKHYSDELKQKLSEVHKGHIVPEEIRKKISDSLKRNPSSTIFKKGNIPWNKGNKLKELQLINTN